MKHLFFAALFLVALLSNCKKEQLIIKTPQPIDTIKPIDTVHHIIGLGQGSALNNGMDWSARFMAYYYGTNGKSTFQLRAKKSYLNSGLEESLFIQDIDFAIGIQNIQGWTTTNLGNSIPESAFAMSNYDEGIGNFYPDTTRMDNFIEVLRFDTVANEVEGRFQVFMGKYGGPSTLPGVPDSVFLTAGKFYLKIQ